MPVIFSTPTSHRVFMFDKDAKIMLEAMRTSGTIPGALYPEALADALKGIQERIQKDTSPEDEKSTEETQAVGIQTKALPLIELIQSAIVENEKLLWKQG